jgi:hypothetical protein
MCFKVIESKLSFFGYSRRCHRLSQGNSTIVGRDLLMGKYFKIIVLQRPDHAAQQDGALKTTSAENHAVQTAFFSDDITQIAKQMDQCSVKFGTYF